ncbi:MAG TPA: SBBP repeat-containing protein [Ignavibacteria bacterium]|nr:SBBP repeat-containing protein [Ignavibacteria bacterium]
MFKITLIIFLFSSLGAFSQVTQDWVTRFNGTGNNMDIANAIVVDGSGNVYVTGHSIGSGTSYDYVTIKYNSNGVMQWSQMYNGTGNAEDFARSIAVDGSGNVYVTGGSRGSGTFDDYVTIKYNTDGVWQWGQAYNGPGDGDDEAKSIAVDGAGNVYVTGQSFGSGTLFDYATIKYNSDGVEQWVQRYHGPGDGSDRAYSIAVDGSGNVYVTGESPGSGSGKDYATIKYSSDGTGLWLQRYNGTGNSDDAALSIAVDVSGNVYVTGDSWGSGGTGSDYATIKYNTDGYGQWVQIYNGPPGTGLDFAFSIAVDGSGNVYVTGNSSGIGTGPDYATIKYNSAGVMQWTSRYNGPANNFDYAYSIALDGSGNAYVTGRSSGSGTGSDYATIRYNSDGTEQWVQRYTELDYDWASSIAVDGSGNVYVTGRSSGSGTSEDYATIKYSQVIGIKSISSEIPNGYKLLQNYPNPFNPSTKIHLALPKSSFAKLVVYDVLGRVVSTLVDEQLKAGTYEVDWNALNNPSGVYYYRLVIDGFTETRKMILIK